jgi:hypothetical protein
MKTDDLIAAMAADAKSTEMPIGRTLSLALAAGGVVAALGFLLAVGPRPDLAGAFSEPRFVFKIALTVMLLVSALGLVWHLARPSAIPIGWVVALAAVPAVLGIGVVTEMISIPPTSWESQIFSMNWRVCMWLIPLLSAAPLVAVIVALRHGAPTHPVLAGAAAGLLSAGIGASLYATHCQSDSPLFIAVWYVIATAIVTTVGALMGFRLLRW